MSNEEILNKRWEKTDKTLKDYLKKFNDLGIEVMDKLVDMFDTLDITYSDLNKPISSNEKRKLNRNIKEWQKRGLLTGYFAYLIESKGKYTYADLLEVLIYGIYAEKEAEQYKLSKEVFTTVANDIYVQACTDLRKKPKKKINWSFIEDLLWIAIYNKSFKEYLKLLTLTAEQEMNKQILTILQQNKKPDEKMLIDLIDKQNKRFLSINEGKYSGVLSDTCRSLGNKVYTELFKEDKDLQVRFIAEMDKRTTKMCESMNNMLFFVNDWNKFYRYSDIDGRDVLYTIKGLEQGINLPPINNHFHWCRSTITYLVDSYKALYKDITNEWFKQKKINKHYKVEQLQYEFKYNNHTYKIDGHDVKYEFKKGEREFATWLSQNSNKRVTLLPKVNVPEGVKTPDYLIDNEYFDYKYTTGSSNQLIFHNLEGKQNQSHNFILEITNKKLSMAEICEQINYTYRKLDWVEKIGIKKDDNFVIFDRK